MTDKAPDDRATELGASLRKARNEMTQTELAAAAGWSGSGKTKVSKIESGRQLPSIADIDAWADITAAPERVRAQWKTLAEQAAAERSAGYGKRMSNGQEPVQKEYTDLAAETTRFRFVETYVLPRYLQVPQYTKAILEEYRDKTGVVNDVDKATDERQSSVRFLYDPNKKFTFLIDEPVLRRRRFPPSIMRPQLDRLLSIIGLSNVTLAIYPSLSRPVNTLLESAFEIFDDVAFIETALEDDKRLLADDVIRLEALFDRYWADAAVNEDARPLIQAAIAALPAE